MRIKIGLVWFIVTSVTKHYKYINKGLEKRREKTMLFNPTLHCIIITIQGNPGEKITFRGSKRFAIKVELRLGTKT